MEEYLHRGDAYFEKEEYDKAGADYTRAIELEPNLAVAYYNRGVAYLRKDKYDEAIADLTKAIELDPRIAMWL